MTKKNIIFISISLVLILLLGIGVSYSMWNITVNQDTVSTMHTDCFDLTISNKENNISLENTYPISNSKGIKLTPYTFTVTNTCDITAQYSINLEVLKNSTLSSKFIDVMLDGNINLLSSYDETDKVDNTSIENRKIDTGILKSNESKDYSLRLWIDYDTTLEDLDNEIKTFKSKIIVVGKPINYTGDTVFNFDYTGGEQTFTVPVSGTYKLETWGSSGYVYKELYNKGGLGGYSNGHIYLRKDTQLYINVGGPGSDGVCTKKYCEGGYNGGGRGAGSTTPLVYSGSGGGATHVATRHGILSSLENYITDILIVSGGGGGNSYQEVTLKNNTEVYSGFAGNGGGFKGTNGTTTHSDFKFGYGGSQISGGTGNYILGNSQRGISGYFGHGGDGYNYSAGGGGGLYGGGSGNQSGAGGGSGYIGNSLLKNKIMYCNNCEESSEVSTKTVSTTCIKTIPTSYCSKGGNGYARITLVSIDE